MALSKVYQNNISVGHHFGQIFSSNLKERILISLTGFAHWKVCDDWTKTAPASQDDFAFEIGFVQRLLRDFFAILKMFWKKNYENKIFILKIYQKNLFKYRLMVNSVELKLKKIHLYLDYFVFKKFWNCLSDDFDVRFSQELRRFIENIEDRLRS